MIRYKPITHIDELKNLYDFTALKDTVYGGYVGFDENENQIGKCLVVIKNFDCEILNVDCDLEDKLLVEGFIRSALNFCANRNAYMAYCSIEEIKDVLLLLGFKNNNGVYEGEIPSLLKGCCGCQK